MGTIDTNGTCLACSVDCSTCSSPGSASSCLTCPSTRPVLSYGRCLEYCPKSSYFDITSNTCHPCNGICGSCIGSGTSQCTSCPDDYLLNAGLCVTATCGKGGFASGLGVCLPSLVAKSITKWTAFAALPVLVAIIGIGAWWYIHRERRKTKQATRDFAEVLDGRGLRHQLLITRLERVLGISRVTATGLSAGQRTEGDRKRLRNLLLPSRRRRETIPLDERKIDKSANERRDLHWVAPPPPYAPSTNVSTSTIATTAMIDDPGCKTKILSMASPVSPDFRPRALFPPPRPRVDRAQREVVREGGLRDLWPEMGSPPLLETRVQGNGRSGRMEHTWI